MEKSSVLPFSTIFSIYLYNIKSQITYSFCEMWLVDLFCPQFCKFDVPRYGYLDVFQRVPWTSRYIWYGVLKVVRILMINTVKMYKYYSILEHTQLKRSASNQYTCILSCTQHLSCSKTVFISMSRTCNNISYGMCGSVDQDKDALYSLKTIRVDIFNLNVVFDKNNNDKTTTTKQREREREREREKNENPRLFLSSLFIVRTQLEGRN